MIRSHQVDRGQILYRPHRCNETRNETRLTGLKSVIIKYDFMINVCKVLN